jgi:hypothetical protein
MTQNEKDLMLKTAAAWIGYLEKYTRDYSLYERKTHGAGLNNWTRFGRLADIVLYGADRRVKDGYPWCAMFILAVLYEMKAGRQDCTAPAGTMTIDAEARRWVADAVNEGSPLTWHAGVAAWLQSYRHRYSVSQQPHSGDFVVYLDKNGKPYHIGIVESVDGGGWFTTIEGNTSAKGEGVEANGGAVARKKRKNFQCVFLNN